MRSEGHVETRITYKDYPIVVVFQRLCHRCGYVGIPEGDIFYKTHYYEIPINCHNGLSYASSSLIDQIDLDTWWIGFSCTHWRDDSDYKSGKKYFSDDPEVMAMIARNEKNDNNLPYPGVIRTKEFCIEECKKIIDQLIAIKEDPMR